MPQARVHLFISGRVQGVFYRSFTEEVALSFGLNGWVRNMPDGRVEAVFEGDKASIEQAVRACRQGPPASRVDDIDAKWEEYLGEFEAFSVRYF